VKKFETGPKPLQFSLSGHNFEIFFQKRSFFGLYKKLERYKKSGNGKKKAYRLGRVRKPIGLWGGKDAEGNAEMSIQPAGDILHTCLGKLYGIISLQDALHSK